MRFCAAFACLALAGCSTLIPPHAEILNVTKGSLVGRWSLASVGGVPVNAGAGVLTFGQDNRMSGQVACNTIRAEYIVPPEQILFRHVSRTQRACGRADDAVLAGVIPSFLSYTDAYVSPDGQGLTMATKRELRFRRFS